METIRNYVEQMFRLYPADARLERLKEEILANMLEKYEELKANGSSEHEAIGAVIAGFGSVEELIRELGLEEPQQGQEPPMSREEIDAFWLDTRRFAGRISTGVGLCILGTAVLVLLGSIGDFLGAGIADLFGTVGVICLLAFVAVAVMLFIIGGNSMSPYAYIDKGEFSLSRRDREWIEEEKEGFRQQFAVMLAIGIGLCVLSVCPVMLTGMLGIGLLEDMGAALLLMIVAAGVFLIVYAGIRNSAYDKLLKEKPSSAGR